ncbi:TetR-like C-terminal domain-containing protein [Streptomyces flavalbus]|uniref:TetR-like C-terminal domain-containing protein n=1 Tax=Streptomyces flavalbus TaxID=2665155 RepID=A0ABW2WMA1_9ACTN
MHASRAVAGGRPGANTRAARTDGGHRRPPPTSLSCAPWHSGRGRAARRRLPGWASRRAAVAELLRQAVERGELAADTDMSLAVDLFGAPLYFRMLAVGGPTDDAYATRLTQAVLAALTAGH